jgi:hypothetical protein
MNAAFVQSENRRVCTGVSSQFLATDATVVLLRLDGRMGSNYP